MDRLFPDRRAGRLEERLGEALHAVDAHKRGRLARLGGKVALVELRERLGLIHCDQESRGRIRWEIDGRTQYDI